MEINQTRQDPMGAKVVDLDASVSWGDGRECSNISYSARMIHHQRAIGNGTQAARFGGIQEMSAVEDHTSSKKKGFNTWMRVSQSLG